MFSNKTLVHSWLYFWPIDGEMRRAYLLSSDHPNKFMLLTENFVVSLIRVPDQRIPLCLCLRLVKKETLPRFGIICKLINFIWFLPNKKMERKIDKKLYKNWYLKHTYYYGIINNKKRCKNLFLIWRPFPIILEGSILRVIMSGY